MVPQPHRHADHAPPSAAVEVSAGIYAYVQPDGSWWINNAGFLVGTRGVVSVDTCATERRTRAYRDAIAQVTDLPVRMVLNTHHHGDHTFGNYLFGGATIVGHAGSRAAAFGWGEPRSAPVWTDVDWGDVELDPPFLEFTGELTLHVDDLVCRVGSVGTPAHTTNDAYVWVPERRVLFAGDLLFNGGTPFLLQGSIAGELEALAHLRALGAETIVPGHGPVCGPEVIDAVEGYVRFVDDVSRRAKAAGLTPLEAALETDLGPFADLLDAERIVGNLHRAYAELDGAPRGAVLDLQPAIADMLAYNGGRPLTCYA